MTDHPIVSPQQWITARMELLRKEKDLTRLRDELTQQRRDLPWERVEKDYTFDGPDGNVTLADLFGDCSQLLVYHFMYAPDWEEGCKSCSLIADHYDPLVVHLRHRDVNLVTISRAPLATLLAYRERMGWSFPWVSSMDSDFNQDYFVLLSEEDIAAGTAYYNYQAEVKFPVADAPGMSAFRRDEDGEIFHTYSIYGRGLEDLMGIYRYLDIVSKGRDEADLPYGMAWVRHHDKYDDATFVDPYV